MAEFRLKDRGVLKGISDYRKRVHRVTDEGGSYVKVEILDKNYRPLFEKNIQAIEFCKKHRVQAPDIIKALSDEMIIYYEDVGENVLDVTDVKLQSQYIRTGIKELAKLHSSQQIGKQYYSNSYIEKFLNIPVFDEKMTKVRLVLDRCMASKWQTVYGPGVTDPTPSNMCVDSQGYTYLIDFDNFTMEVSFFESLGFVVGDYLFKNELLISNFKELYQIVRDWGLDEYIDFHQVSTISNREFWLGFLSVYLTLYQDVFLDISEAEIRLSRFEPNIQLGIQHLSKTFQL